jgi:mannose-6-phosphate isomerase-like protein (cupin superfamily)
MSRTQPEKSSLVVEILEFVPDSPSHKTVIKKQTGTIHTSTLDSADLLTERHSASDSFAMVVEGHAVIEMNGKTQSLQIGKGIMIPAHQAYKISSDERFKLILTIVKHQNDH